MDVWHTNNKKNSSDLLYSLVVILPLLIVIFKLRKVA